LGATRALQGREEVAQVRVEIVPQNTLRVGIQTLDRVINKVLVQLAELAEICGVRIDGIAVDTALVSTRLDRMRLEDEINQRPNNVKANGLIGSEESIRHPAILEKSTSDIQGECTVFVPAIHEECDWEGRFGVGGEIARGNEGEVRIGGG